jgi:phosphoglycolate phosphatase-like HAD superfamily hydrolase
LEQGTRIILWDIDGTLIRNRDNISNKHILAINEVMGIEAQAINNTSGMTDLQIVKKIADINSINLSPNQLQSILVLLDELTKKEIKAAPTKAHFNVEKTLKKTNLRGWQNGVLTGNTQKRGELKIKSAKLTKYLNSEYFFFGNTFTDRNKLVEQCTKYLSNRNIYRTVIVGDTPLDIISAKKQNVPVIAIANGKFTYQELDKFNPDGLVKNLDDEDHLFLKLLDTFFV